MVDPPTALGSNGSTDVLAEASEVVRRVVGRRIPDRDVVDEIAQETIARVLGTRRRLDDSAVLPYAIVVARNLIASHWRGLDTDKRHEHRLVDRTAIEQPDDSVVADEEKMAIRAALERLSPSEREVLVAHDVSRQDTKSLADDLGSTSRAITAQLHRTRAKLRVEYLLEMHGRPPSARCQPVLFSLSDGDRRRQREVDAGQHLLECDFCAGVSEPLLDRRSKRDDEVRVGVRVDADIVTARQKGRELAMRAGFSDSDATVVATAISEIARNIVRFARRGEVVMTMVADGDTSGVTIVARDAGPGIPDIDQAMVVGYTTYGGRGLGLPGTRRLMDEFEITSEPGRGTTVTMTKWHRD